MQFDDVIGRVIRRHAVLIAIGVLLGLGAAWFVHADDQAQYAATVRLVLDSPDPQSQAQAAGLADTAKAIATGPSLLRKAAAEAGVRRDPVELGDHHVDVQPLGGSGVLRLVVTDRSADAAQKLANAIAAAVIVARSRVTDGSAAGAVKELDVQVADVNKQITALDARIDALTPAPGQVAADQSTLRSLQRNRDALVRQLDELQSQLVSVQSERSLRPQAGVIEPATSATAVPGHTLPDYVLGALLGLVLGLGAAAARETFAPTASGGDAVARAVGGPLLAELPGPVAACQPADGAVAARHVELAALAAGVLRVQVMSVDPTADIDRFVRYLDDVQDEVPVHRIDPADPARWTGLDTGRRSDAPTATEHVELVLPESLRPAGLPNGEHNGTADGRRNGADAGPSAGRSSGRPSEVWRTGLVVVAPRRVRLAELRAVHNLLTITSWPLLGVVVYRSGRSPFRRRPSRPEIASVPMPRRFKTALLRRGADKTGESLVRPAADRR